VEQLLVNEPAETSADSLHALREMDSDAQWPALDEILAQEPRLRLQATAR